MNPKNIFLKAIKGKAILISPSNLYDAQSGLSLPLAISLRGKLITAMTSRHVRVLLPGANEERRMFLQGSWQKEGENLNLYLKVSKLGSDGPEAIASADIPAALFPPELLKRPEPAGATHGPQVFSRYDKAISVNGLKLELTTTRGEGKASYPDGEKIRFVLRLNRKAIVYVFDLDPQGKATSLYPVDASGRLAQGGKCGRLPEPGKPLIIPEDGCSYNLEVSRPYGKDTVWAVASETPLKFPSNLGGEWQDGNVLVKRVREQGLLGRGGYAEAQVEVETGPRRESPI